ncbi:replication protein [Halocella sp. SP3-1]|uniref:replication protein n=1 Tax=Halocella sp. SP3-1 TaxID=2382161 RepID=UPI000F76204A|nr:replication protein [Halocella sp. SP3-1]AZO95248.1 DnaD domain protein [Halocella sp. SP3-1]
MANPQPDSYTKLSNEILEAIMKSQFSKRQLNILFLIWRCSYGFSKKVAKLKKSDFQYVGVYPGDITKELLYLQEAKVIYWDEENDLIAFNKDYDRWRISLSRAVVNGKADISKILKRQFEKFSKTLNKDISKILNLPVDNSENVSETLSPKKRKLSKTLNTNNSLLSKTLSFSRKKVSKTLNGQFSEPSNDAFHEVPKETSTKEINNNTSSSNDNLINYHESNSEKPDEEDEEKSKIPNAYFNAFNCMISPTQLQILESYIEDGLSEEIIILALEQAALNNAKSLNYVQAILNSWLEKKVSTVEQAKQAIIEHKAKQKNKSSPQKTNIVNFERENKSDDEVARDYYQKGYR